MMYVCMYIRIHVCMYIRIHIFMYIHLFESTYVGVSICTNISMYKRRCVCMYIHIFVCIYACIFVCDSILSSLTISIFGYLSFSPIGICTLFHPSNPTTSYLLSCSIPTYKFSLNEDVYQSMCTFYFHVCLSLSFSIFLPTHQSIGIMNVLPDIL